MDKIDFALNIEFDKILTNPILDIAARFWDDDRYHAFQVCYRSMRQIDDLIDDRKATGTTISKDEAKHLISVMQDWIGSVREMDNLDPFQEEFLQTLKTYKIPFWPWERLCNAMAFDAKNDGFKSFLEFLRYTEGAAISPAAVFMHLSGLRKDGDGIKVPRYDIRKAARPLAIFSYLVHIVRDFQKDSKENLVYFPNTMLKKYQISREDLFFIAETEQPSESFRQLIKEYKRIGLYFKTKARAVIDETLPLLEPKYKLSLEIIYALYNQIFERIDPINGTFVTAELNPTPSEVKERLELTIAQFQQKHSKI